MGSKTGEESEKEHLSLCLKVGVALSKIGDDLDMTEGNTDFVDKEDQQTVENAALPCCCCEKKKLNDRPLVTF